MTFKGYSISQNIGRDRKDINADCFKMIYNLAFRFKKWYVTDPGCAVCIELPTLYQACLRVLMDNIDGKCFSVQASTYIVSQKKSPPPLRPVFFLNFFTNG